MAASRSNEVLGPTEMQATKDDWLSACMGLLNRVLIGKVELLSRRSRHIGFTCDRSLKRTVTRRCCTDGMLCSIIGGWLCNLRVEIERLDIERID